MERGLATIAAQYDRLTVSSFAGVVTMAFQEYAGPERRRDARVQRSFVVPFRLRDGRGVTVLSSGEARVHDLSASGMCLALPGPLTHAPKQLLEDRARVECHLPIEDQDIWLNGRTVWISHAGHERSGTGNAGCCLGLVFEKNPLVRAAMDRLLGFHPVPTSQSREQLAALLEVSHLLTSSLDQEHLLQLILDTVSRLFRADGSSLLLVDPHSGELVFWLPFGPGSEKLKEVRLRSGQGIAGLVAKERRPIMVNDVQHDPRFYSDIDTLTGFKTRSILAAPLLDGERLVGVIEVLNTNKEKRFVQEDLELISAFAAHASVALRNARLFSTMQEEKTYLQNEVEERYRILIGESSIMQEAIRMARKAAATPVTVLLLGESGVGKEIFARSIHAWSARARKPFRAVNCVALSEHLLESELFGHERGAFTGAVQQKKGLFEQANGGTLFLDEIGDMKPELQAKLLRVLQDHTFERVGGTHPIHVDVRIIAATNQDLEAAVRAGKFRKDLFYRLNVVTITLSPLRERKEDIPALANLFLQRYNRELKRSLAMGPEALELLQQYNWPGNVRELENVIERAVVLAGEPTIRPKDIALGVSCTPSEPSASPEDLPFHDSLEAHKKAVIEAAIAKASGRKHMAARSLGLNPTYLSRLCRQLGID